MEEQKHLEPLQPERQEEHHAFQEFMSPRPNEINPNEVNPAENVSHHHTERPTDPLDPVEPLEPEKDQPYGPSGPSEPAKGYRTGGGK